MPFSLPTFLLPPGYARLVLSDAQHSVDGRHYGSINSTIHSPDFGKIESRVVFLYKHPELTSTNQILASLDALSLRPATAAENIALSILYPEFRHYGVLAFGENAEGVGGCANVPVVDCYRKWGCQKPEFHIWSFRNGWTTFWSFSAVPK